MKFERHYSKAGVPVRDQVRWKRVTARIAGKGDEPVFEMQDVEVPEHWSQRATNILAQKYFRKAGVPSFTVPADPDSDLPWFLQPHKAGDGCTFAGERSAHDVFHRLAGCWAYWGWKSGMFHHHGDRISQVEEYAQIFYDELYMMLALQVAAPNSPQWFNTGLHWAYGIEGPDSGQWYAEAAPLTKDFGTLAAEAGKLVEPTSKPPSLKPSPNSYERPQPHACFLTSVADDLVNEGGIMDAWVREARIFKHGSGSGTNLSKLRARGEPLSGGGVASGVMSWLRIADRAAGAIASGGTTRRAATMRILDVNHPEIETFIDWKVREEAKAAAMFVGSQAIGSAGSYAQSRGGVDGYIPQAVIDRINAGFEPEVFGIGWEGEAIDTVSGQNSNNSIRVTDAFMQAVEEDKNWDLTARTTGKVVKTVRARDLWDRACRAAWACADPGVLFHDNINRWSTCANDGEITTTNPCFTGDTKVWTIYGPKRFDQLAAVERIPVLTELADGQLAYRDMVAPRITNTDAELVEVTFRAKGTGWKKASVTTLRCTPNHRFFLRDGRIKRADELEPGDRIKSAYRSVNTYSDVRNGFDAVGEHTLVAEYDYGRRPIQGVEHAHHIDRNKLNNVSGNIEIVPIGKHHSEHALEYWSSLTDENRAALGAKIGRATKGHPHYGPKNHSEESRQKISLLKLGNKSLTGKKWITNGTIDRVVNINDPLPDGWMPGRLKGKKRSAEFCERMRVMALAREERKREKQLNHRVISVHVLPTPQDVYCGTVRETGRFFVSLGDKHAEGVLVSNCSEFHHLCGTPYGSSACNLASLRLTAFLRADKSMDLDAYEHAVRLWTCVLDISVTMASFPAKEFALGAYNYRTLGLGWMDLGGLLAKLDVRYDSDEARALAASLTAMMTGIAYRTSAELAEALGPFPRWKENEASFRAVMKKHDAALWRSEGEWPWPPVILPSVRGISNRIGQIWQYVLKAESFRNAQVTLIAPTGTISLVTDCQTSGIEPFFSRESVKNLAGGGTMEFSFDVRDEDTTMHLPPMAHVKMMAAVQPFLSGAISKTVNMPANSLVSEVDAVYRAAHRMGLKAVAIYRDGSKLSQPLNVKSTASRNTETTALMFKSVGLAKQSAEKKLASLSKVAAQSNVTDEKQPGTRPDPVGSRIAGPSPQRVAPSDGVSGQLIRGDHEYLPWRREHGYTQKAKINGQSLFWRVSEYPDGRPGEIFIELAHEGSTLRATANCVAIGISVGLQHGTPLEAIVDKYLSTKFEPAGYVEGHDRIKFATSFADLIARDLAITYLGREDLANTVRPINQETLEESVVALDKRAVALAAGRFTGEVCRVCGGLLVQTGTCQTCQNCGWNEGCA